MERLADEDITGDDLKKEIDRASAICSVSAQIIANGQLALKAVSMQETAIAANQRIPAFLKDKKAHGEAV